MNKSLLDSLICPICLDYSENPVNATCCEAIYCKECSKGLSACSMCRAKCEFKESLFAKRLINTIEDQCECGYKCSRGDMNEHKKKCERLFTACPIDKCKKKLKRTDCFEHIAKEHQIEMMQKMDSVLQVFQNKKEEKLNVAFQASEASKTKVAVTNTKTIDEMKNKFGWMARLGSSGKYYCGKRLDGPRCACCNGFCGPVSGCSIFFHFHLHSRLKIIKLSVLKVTALDAWNWM